MSAFDPKQMQFIRSPRSQMRSADAEFRETAKHSRLERFEESVRKTESAFERLLEMPIVLAVLILIFYVAVVGTIAGFLGWRP